MDLKAQGNISLPNFGIRWILIIIRLSIAWLIMACLVIFHDYIRPHIMIPYIRRYISCIINLFWIRLILLLFGFFKFQSQNIVFFSRQQRSITFRSGWAGIAPKKNIIDFLYYTCLFNPTYARVVYYQNEEKKNIIQTFYSPLTMRQALEAAMQFGGFDPIYLKGQKQLKQFKRRKMILPTIISQCFEELLGPILIFWPYCQEKKILKMSKSVGEDMYENQRKFLRSIVIFSTEIQQEISFLKSSQKRMKPEYLCRNYQKQLDFLLELCSRMSRNVLEIRANEIIKNKYSYTKDSIAGYIDEDFKNNLYQIVDELNQLKIQHFIRGNSSNHSKLIEKDQ